MSEEMIIGKNPVMEALKSDRAIHKILISQHLHKQTGETISRLGKAKGTIVQRVPKQKLNQLSGGNHQGVIAYVAAYEYVAAEDILSRSKEKEEDPFIIVLDELEDPHNLGSILRTAEAVGAHGVIIPERRAAGLTQTVAKTAAGALEHVPVAQVTNIAKTIDWLKQEGIWVVGTDSYADEDYRTMDGNIPVAIVIGNEGKGMRRLVSEKCDWIVTLPMMGSNASLNASVACGLLLYEVYRRRHPLEKES